MGSVHAMNGRAKQISRAVLVAHAAALSATLAPGAAAYAGDSFNLPIVRAWGSSALSQPPADRKHNAFLFRVWLEGATVGDLRACCHLLLVAGFRFGYKCLRACWLCANVLNKMCVVCTEDFVVVSCATRTVQA